MSGWVWDGVYELARRFQQERATGVYSKVVCTSLPGDPLHIGHIRLLQASQSFGRLVVVVNSDRFLIQKKGYAFMPLKERMELIAAIEGVRHVVPWDDGTQTVVGALELLRPETFTKGGDRTPETMAGEEVEACERIRCKIEYGVGGLDKPQSSSQLVLRVMEQLRMSQR